MGARRRRAGTPLTFDADLTVTDEPAATPYDYDLRVNHPLEVDGTSVYLVGHGYAPAGDRHATATGNVAFSGPVIFLPQDGSFVSFGVIKAPDAAPDQLGFEGYFFPTASLCDGAPVLDVPGRRQPGAVADRLPRRPRPRHGSRSRSTCSTRTS